MLDGNCLLKAVIRLAVTQCSNYTPATSGASGCKEDAIGEGREI